MTGTPPLSLAEAQARLLALTTPLPLERLEIDEVIGRYLAQPLTALRDQPSADVSAMDGYAVRGDDLAGPWRVVGESAAGHPFSGAWSTGQAIRISTGAQVPDGAGTVIIQEDVEGSGDDISLRQGEAGKSGQNIRPAGLDFRSGESLLEAGTLLTPAAIALAITAGYRHLPVRRAPRVTIIDSGDELAPAGAWRETHGLPASNGLMLAAMLAVLPCTTRLIGPVADDAEALANALATAADADIIVTSGGASVGDHDLVRPVLQEWGAEVDFWRVAIKPGKPLIVSRKGAQIVLGLPGNPSSAFVTAYLFLLPLVRALLGASQPLPQARQLPLAEPIGPGGKRMEFLRGRWGPDGVTTAGLQDSSMLVSLAAAEVLIQRPADAPPAAAGSLASVFLLNHAAA